MTRKIRVLIINATPSRDEWLESALAADPQMDVVGVVDTEARALAALARDKPDVVTVDVAMTRVDAFDLTRRIMEVAPAPVVMIGASWRSDEVATTVKALQAGAVAVANKPPGLNPAPHDPTTKKLLQTIKAMSEVRVVRRRASSGTTASTETSPRVWCSERPDVGVVTIGASTGGPAALQVLLAGLPPGFGVPVLIVQHIARGFVHGLADWLRDTTGMPIQVAENGQVVLPGYVYLAPDAHHMGLRADGRITLTTGAGSPAPCPSVASLFASVAESFGPRAIGVLLTGMGRDGARELELMKRCGALTIAQDEESSVTYGMPGEAVRLNAAMYVLAPDGIAGLLGQLVKRQSAPAVR